MAGVEAMRARGCIVASGVRQDWCGELLDTEEVVITRLCRVVWAGLGSIWILNRPFSCCRPAVAGSAIPFQSHLPFKCVLSDPLPTLV